MATPPRTRLTGAAGLATALSLALAGCNTAAPQPPTTAPPEPGLRAATRDGPAGAPPDSCWGKTVTPAVIETITRQVQTEPARRSADGTITSLPVYTTDTDQRIVTPRQDNWFETPCPDQLTPEFIASLQRALQARGHYTGPITAEMDNPTRAAIRRLQARSGPDSDVLSLALARQLGLIAVPRTD